MKSRSFSGTLKVYIRIMSILPSCLGILEISRPISCYKNSLVRCAHSFVLVAGYWTRYFPVSRDKRVILIHYPAVRDVVTPMKATGYFVCFWRNLNILDKISISWTRIQYPGQDFEILDKLKDISAAAGIWTPAVLVRSQRFTACPTHPAGY